jgi:uncharacterized iron-regulated protein
VRADYAAVLGEPRVRELGLATPPDAEWQAAQQREIELGHCGRLPPTLLPGMARAQFARDALMAQTLLHDASRGAVLLAGNGHVRRDIGVPRWLAGLAPQRVWSVGFLETPDADASTGLFDAVVVTAAASRDADPCDQVSEPKR